MAHGHVASFVPSHIIFFPSLQDEIARSQQMCANLVEKVFNRCNPEKCARPCEVKELNVWRAAKAGMVSVACKVQGQIAQARERAEVAFSVRADENRHPTTGIKVGALGRRIPKRRLSKDSRINYSELIPAAVLQERSQ
jgi:hypothetical protein